MLLNGRLATSAFAIADVRPGSAATSASVMVLTSDTPCDLPTCADAAAAEAATIAAVQNMRASFIDTFISILLVAVSVRESDETQLDEHAGGERRRHLGLEDCEQQRAPGQRRIPLTLELDVRRVVVVDACDAAGEE